VLGSRQNIKGVLAGASCDTGIVAREIGFRNLQVENGLTLGLVFGLDDLASLVFVMNLKTRALTGLRVHAIKSASADAAPN
jgi:hypothetical protein